MPTTTAPVTMSDATQSNGNPPPREAATAETDHAPAVTVDVVKTGDAPSADVKSEVATSETAKSEPEPMAEKLRGMASSDDKPAEVKSSDTAKTETSAIEDSKVDEPKVEPKADDVKKDTSVSDTPKPVEVTEAKPDEAKPTEAKSVDVKPAEAKPVEKSDAKTTPATDTAAIPDAKKDQTRLPGTEKAAAPKPDPATAAAPKRTGQIAVFISRKDAKLYVRQNFKPLFSVPVTIAPGDRPLGTHVFTAQVDKEDANVLHWSVVSLPARRVVERRDEDERVSRRRKKTAEVAETKVMPVPDSPSEALDRITIPADAMARIAESLSTGGSIVVSDQGINAGETGEGTDFIVSLH